MKELGIRDVKFHTTRHTFATRALEIGMDIKTLSEILGHASPTVTLNICAHSLPEHKAKEMDRLGKMYKPSNIHKMPENSNNMKCKSFNYQFYDFLFCPKIVVIKHLTEKGVFCGI